MHVSLPASVAAVSRAADLERILKRSSLPLPYMRVPPCHLAILRSGLLKWPLRVPSSSCLEMGRDTACGCASYEDCFCLHYSIEHRLQLLLVCPPALLSPLSHTAPRVRSSSFAQSADLSDEVTTLLFAGHDTQSATLSWALAELALAPAVQERLRGEILRELGPEPSSRGTDMGSGAGDAAGTRTSAGAEARGEGEVRAKSGERASRREEGTKRAWTEEKGPAANRAGHVSSKDAGAVVRSKCHPSLFLCPLLLLPHAFPVRAHLTPLSLARPHTLSLRAPALIPRSLSLLPSRSPSWRPPSRRLSACTLRRPWSLASSMRTSQRPRAGPSCVRGARWRSGYTPCTGTRRRGCAPHAATPAGRRRTAGPACLPAWSL